MLPYVFLKLQGFDVDMPDLKVRKNISEAGEYRDSYDLHLSETIFVEVKSRPMVFTTPNSWPYRTAFVDTISKWDRKTIKPFAYIFTSRATGAMLATRGDEEAKKARWGESLHRWDNVRKIYEDFYIVDRKYLYHLNHLVDHLRKALSKPHLEVEESEPEESDE